mgnify:FL=1
MIEPKIAPGRCQFCENPLEQPETGRRRRYCNDRCRRDAFKARQSSGPLSIVETPEVESGNPSPLPTTEAPEVESGNPGTLPIVEVPEVESGNPSPLPTTEAPGTESENPDLPSENEWVDLDRISIQELRKLATYYQVDPNTDRETIIERIWEVADEVEILDSPPSTSSSTMKWAHSDHMGNTPIDSPGRNTRRRQAMKIRRDESRAW